jgi:hypothetical protein
MTIKRYRYDPNEECFNEHERGNVVFWADHQEIVDRHERTVEGLRETIKISNDRLKPSKQHMYLVQWWIGPHDPIMAVKHYDALEDFLSNLAENSSINDISVCALHPVKVTTKKVLTVEL